MSLDASRAEAQERRHFGGRVSLELAQREDFALAGRQTAVGLPHAALLLAADDFVFGRPHRRAQRRLVERDAALAPPTPPSRPTAVATGVDGDAREPRAPIHGPRLDLTRLVELREHVLDDVRGLVRV